MSQDDQHSEATNPYASPEFPSVASGAAASEDSETQQLRAFVGSKAEYYLDKWTPILQGWDRGAGFNGAAFFLSGLWLPYRKMYKVSFIFYAIIILDSILEEVIFVGMLGMAETPAALDRVVGLVAAAVCGAYGNRWYLSHARSVISDVSVTGVHGEALLQMLAKRGGTSVAASLGMFMLFIVVLVAALLPVVMLLYPE